jgi:tyrosine-protein phosphatase SIW14
MRTSAVRAATVLVIMSLAGRASIAQDNPSYPELPNFHKVNEHLYRGAQPSKGGLKKLAELGVKTIINLRDEQDLSKQEGTEAAKAGLQYFSVPMAGLGRPTETQLSQVIAIIDAPANWPAFIHCKHGSDRTGTVVACYHILHDGWKSDKAISEARRFGMSWVEFGMRDYISHYQPAHAPAHAGDVAAKEVATATAQPESALPRSGETVAKEVTTAALAPVKSSLQQAGDSAAKAITTDAQAPVKSSLQQAGDSPAKEITTAAQAPAKSSLPGTPQRQ